jgi:hypothetical protein
MHMIMILSMSLLLGTNFTGCGQAAPSAAKPKKKVVNSPVNKQAPGPASKKRAAYNQAGSKSLSSGGEVAQLWIDDLKSRDREKIIAAIEELRNIGAKSAVPELQKLAKSGPDTEIRNRAQAAASYLSGQ